ncbi:MAG: 30S ribosomal protein S5 [Azospirillum brasilense]|nr:MAG: 30S ribosomal protein S5 [Azospirillum brasilense]
MAFEAQQQNPRDNNRGGNRDNRDNRGGRDRDNRNQDQGEGSEFVDRLVSINRVAKTVKGGRRFTFAALVVVGDTKGKIGYGTGKAKEVQDAVNKAKDAAKKSMIRIPLRESRTLHHDVKSRYGAGRVMLRSAPAGTGIIAGGPMRAIFEALGVHDVVAKSTGTSNPHNMVKATFAALKLVNSPRLVASRRSMKVGEVVERRETGAKAAGVHNEAE